MSIRPPSSASRDPLVLIVPGLNNSGPGHWQSVWENTRTDCQRVELGMWDQPHRNSWVNKLNLAIRQADRPVILAAHSLGCLAVAWWAQLEQPGPESPVRGALLVAPPEVDRQPRDERLSIFAPTPAVQLPFPAILVGSHDDHYMSYEAARQLARTWGARFADAGHVGHVNAASGLGDWQFGQFLLNRLIRQARGQTEPQAPRFRPDRQAQSCQPKPGL